MIVVKKTVGGSFPGEPVPEFSPRDWTRVSCIAGRFFTTESPGKPQLSVSNSLNIID